MHAGTTFIKLMYAYVYWKVAYMYMDDLITVTVLTNMLISQGYTYLWLYLKNISVYGMH